MDDIFQTKIDKLLSGMSNVFSIADDILIVGFNEQGIDHDVTLDKALRIGRKANLKLKNNKCLLRCTRIAFFSDVISW